MARPKKQTVDYFPHSCIHKKTIYILEQRYGNTGYAFWFKLLELLGSTEGHILNLMDDTQLYFLSAKVLIDNDQCIEILNLLSKLDAIDRELWEQDKVVWCQNFIDNIKSVYEKRTIEMPNKPSFRQQKPLSTVEQVNDNPQSKLNETKLNETKVIKYVAEEIDYENIKKYYHKICVKLPKIKEINETRKNNIKKRIEQYGKEALVTVINNTASSDFLSGISTEWKANFDWIIKKENFIKILEGNYVNNSKSNNQGVKRTIEANPEILKANAEATQRKKEREEKEQNDQNDMFAKMTKEEISEHLKKLGIGVN